MIEALINKDWKKYGFGAGIFAACFLIGLGIWMYVKEAPSSEPELGIPVSSVPSSSVGEDKEPEFSDANLNAPPLDPVLEEEPSSDIFIEVHEKKDSITDPKKLTPDFYFNQGVAYDEKNQKELAINSYEKALFLSDAEPFHFSKQAVLQRLRFLKAA